MIVRVATSITSESTKTDETTSGTSSGPDSETGANSTGDGDGVAVSRSGLLEFCRGPGTGALYRAHYARN